MTPKSKPVGRDLDALVAERVMGHKVSRNPKGGWSLGPPDWYDDAGLSVLHNPLPRYSTDIAAAWAVVDRICGDSRLYEFNLYRYGDNEHTATFTTTSDFRAHGESVPHAICLAALRAVGAL